MEGKYVAYVGTYTHENSVGIHIYDVDELRNFNRAKSCSNQ